MSQIWTQILQSNLFNFVLMLILLGWIIDKFKIADVLEKGRKSIEDKIATSNQEKENALSELYKVQENSKNIESKVFDILEKSENNATIVGEKILSDAERQSKEFSENTKKIIDTNIKSLKLNLTAQTADEVINLAKKYIVNELNSDKNLHIKFINESIDALNGVEL